MSYDDIYKNFLILFQVLKWRLNNYFCPQGAMHSLQKFTDQTKNYVNYRTI